MTAPRFRSTASFTLRNRQSVPAIDRATFVVFSLDGCRFAASVESVERVLRPDADSASPDRTIVHAGRSVPIVDLRPVIGVAGSDDRDANHRDAAPRLLVFALPSQWIAAEVDTVYEVATIDAATVQMLPSTRADGLGWPVGARGLFTRHQQEVIVLDMARVLTSALARL